MWALCGQSNKGLPLLWQDRSKEQVGAGPDISARCSQQDSGNGPESSTELCDDVRALRPSSIYSTVRGALTVHPQQDGRTPPFLGHSARELHIPHKVPSSRVGAGGSRVRRATRISRTEWWDKSDRDERTHKAAVTSIVTRSQRPRRSIVRISKPSGYVEVNKRMQCGRRARGRNVSSQAAALCL